MRHGLDQTQRFIMEILQRQAMIRLILILMQLAGMEVIPVQVMKERMTAQAGTMVQPHAGHKLSEVNLQTALGFLT